MVALDSPEWSELNHAYGAATDIPELLANLRENPAPAASPDDEPWFTLWSSLCHQGDAYTASYAAVPHIISIAEAANTAFDASFITLPANIEIARKTEKAPEIPANLAAPYRDAITRLPSLVTVFWDQVLDEDTFAAALSAVAVSKGYIRLGEAIGNLDRHLIDRLINLDFE